MKKAFKIIPLLIIVIFIALFFLLKQGEHQYYGKLIDSINIANDTVTLLTKKVDVNGDIIDVSIIKVDITKADIGITSPEILERSSQISGYSGYSLSEYLKLGKYKVVQSGGFLSSWSPPHPLGYVKVQGKEYSKPHQSWLTKGVFCTNGDSFTIEEYKSIDQFKNWRSCIQAGPSIISNGRIILNTDRNTGYVTKMKHRQSFLCKSEDGNLLMGIAENVILDKFSTVMVTPEDKGGLGCVDAVLLTSKGIAGMLTNIDDNTIEIGNIDVPLPNAIVVK